VMPLDILGCTRATMEILASVWRASSFNWFCQLGEISFRCTEIETV
jgi:hypothetical protein